MPPLSLLLPQPQPQPQPSELQEEEEEEEQACKEKEEAKDTAVESLNNDTTAPASGSSSSSALITLPQQQEAAAAAIIAPAAEEEQPSTSSLADDNEYEFDAPQHYDFTAEEEASNEQEIDSWFDKCVEDAGEVFDDYDDYGSFDAFPNDDDFVTTAESQLPAFQDGNEDDDLDVTRQMANLSVAATSNELPQRKSSIGWDKLSKPGEAAGAQKQQQKQTHTTTKRRRETTQPKSTARYTITNAPALRRAPSLTASTATLPPVRVRPLTVPKEFSFVTRFRAKHSALAVRSPGIQKKRFSTITRRPNGTTRPKPFRFHSTLRAVAHEVTGVAAARTVPPPPRSPFIPLAVAVNAFSNESERFRPLSKRDRRKAMPSSPWAGRMRMTRPQSPYLLTKMRTKTHHIPSREELELASLSSVQPFKANPIPSSILHVPAPLPPPQHHRPPTIPESPFITKSRPLSQLNQQQPSPERIPHARPVPRHVLENPFEPVIEHRVIPVPEFELPGDQISRRKKEDFERRRREEEEREKAMRGFRAQPLPFDDDDDDGLGHHLPHVEPRPLTNPQPFTLETDLRGTLSQQQLAQRLALEQHELAQRAQFRAQPFNAHVIVERPFLPHASDKPLTSTVDVVLSSEQRAEERRNGKRKLSGSCGWNVCTVRNPSMRASLRPCIKKQQQQQQQQQESKTAAMLPAMTMREAEEDEEETGSASAAAAAGRKRNAEAAGGACEADGEG
ncbi:Protein tpx2 [Geranomyces michiganensis]|nr:Protein tpx2 [Geranomyces michiganensis]